MPTGVKPAAMVSMEAIAMGGLLAFGLAVLAGAGTIASTGLGRVRTARRLREAGPIPIGDVADTSGLVEFEGTARTSDRTLEAPLSGEPCLAYSVRARSWDGSSADAPWRVDGEAADSVPFAVEDGTARLVVDPANAVLSLDGWEPETTPWTDRDVLPVGASERLRTAGLPGLEGATAGDDSTSETERQYRERRLEPGGDVHVFGGSVVDATGSAVTVGGDDWLEITAGGTDRPGGTVVADRRRSGSLYVIFGVLIAVPGVGFMLAGIAGLVSTLL